MEESVPVGSTRQLLDRSSSSKSYWSSSTGYLEKQGSKSMSFKEESWGDMIAASKQRVQVAIATEATTSQPPVPVKQQPGFVMMDTGVRESSLSSAREHSATGDPAAAALTSTPRTAAMPSLKAVPTGGPALKSSTTYQRKSGDSRKRVRFNAPLSAAERDEEEDDFQWYKRMEKKRRFLAKTSTVYPRLPVWLVFSLMETQRFVDQDGSRRSRMCQVLGTVVVVLAVLTFLLCLALLGMYLYLRPRIPLVTIDSLTLNWININPVDEDKLLEQQLRGEGNYYAYNVSISGLYGLHYSNTNKRVDIHNQQFIGSIVYRGTILASSHLGEFMVARNSGKTLELLMENDLLLRLDVGYTLLAELLQYKFDFVSEFVIMARLSSTLGTLMSPLFGMRVRCYFLLTDLGIERQVCKNFNF